MRFLIDFKGFLVSVLGDFDGFLGSGGLPGSPVGALGLPWGANVTPRRLPRGSGGGFGLDFGVPGAFLGDNFRHFFRNFGVSFGLFFGGSFWRGSRYDFEWILRRFSKGFSAIVSSIVDVQRALQNAIWTCNLQYLRHVGIFRNQRQNNKNCKF